MQGWKEKAHKFLYWFTHTELHPVSPYPKVEFTKKTVPITYRHNSSWTLQEQHNQCWKNLFQHTLHSKKPYQGVTTLTPLQTRIKERLHLKRRCKNSKPVVQFAAELHQHLHQDQRFPRTSTLENLFGKPFKKSFDPSSHMKNVWSLSKT